MRHFSSLRAKLLVLLLGAVVVVWGASAAFVYFDTRHEMNEVLDAQLAQSAKGLLAQASHELLEHRAEREGVATEIRAGDHQYERQFAFQLWDAEGQLLLRSSNAPRPSLAPGYLAAGPASIWGDGHGAHGEGHRGRFDDTVIDGQRWRVFSHWGEKGEILVQVGERETVRRELTAHVAGRLLDPLAVGLPLLGVLVWIAVGRGLAPLWRVRDEVALRDHGHLAPIEARNAPAEIQPLVESLNSLLDRLGEALENERRFTADAAHELRTPLAALKTQAQVALRAEDATQRRTALENLIRGTDRATHLVEQLLTLARLDPEAAPGAMERCDLAVVARQILADLMPAALAKGIALELSGADVAPSHGNPAMLGILVRNLVDNAIRYTPPEGAIKVRVEPDFIEVTDSGPGIPEAELGRVFDRFYRVLGHDVPGSGLGLSIVKRIADLHGATLTLTAGDGGLGLRATVSFSSGKNRSSVTP